MRVKTQSSPSIRLNIDLSSPSAHPHPHTPHSERVRERRERSWRGFTPHAREEFYCDYSFPVCVYRLLCARVACLRCAASDPCEAHVSPLSRLRPSRLVRRPSCPRGRASCLPLAERRSVLVDTDAVVRTPFASRVSSILSLTNGSGTWSTLARKLVRQEVSKKRPHLVRAGEVPRGSMWQDWNTLAGRGVN